LSLFTVSHCHQNFLKKSKPPVSAAQSAPGGDEHSYRFCEFFGCLQSVNHRKQAGDQPEQTAVDYGTWDERVFLGRIVPLKLTVTVFPLTLVVPGSVAILGSAVELAGMVLVPGKEKASAFRILALTDVINTKKTFEICT